MWIALKFFVLLQSKQLRAKAVNCECSCELLSNFLYFCSRNNINVLNTQSEIVVNCSQIFCTFAVETTDKNQLWQYYCCELLSNFLYFCSRNNHPWGEVGHASVVNCSQIFCTFAVETTRISRCWKVIKLWIALKFFVLLQSKQHSGSTALMQRRCELLSNFLYFCSRNNG